MPDLYTKESTQTDFKLNWSQLQDGARLILEPAVIEWAQTVRGFQGLDLHVSNLVKGEPKSVYAFGNLQGEGGRLPLGGLDIKGVSIYFYGTVPVAKRYELVSSLSNALKWLINIQRKMLGAFSFKHSPLIMYHAAELEGRWVLLEANKALADFLGINIDDLIGPSAKAQVLDYVHPDDLQQLITSYDYIRTTTRNMALNYRIRGVDGSYVPVTEYVRYSQDITQKRSQSVLWLQPDEPPKFSDATNLFNNIESFMQDISFETGRDFLVHFCRRLEASKKIPWLLFCVPLNDDWWETWVISRRGFLLPPFAFQPNKIRAIDISSFNQQVPESCSDFEKECLFGGHPIVSTVKLADESERNRAYLLFGTEKPIKDIAGFEEILQFAGKRVLREIWQARLADAQLVQNELLLRQKNQLTSMVTLLGQLDTIADESEFLWQVQENLQKTFNLSSLDLVYWASGDWHTVLQAAPYSHYWNEYSTLAKNESWIKSLEKCRREDNLVLERATHRIYWPLGQSHVGYLVMVMTVYSDMPDLELLNFSRNALSLALQGLMQRENLRLQAMRDSLTGLGNRTQLHAWIKVALPTQKQASLLLFDLNRFKEINDSFGHQFGDKLLCEIGPRIADNLSDKAHYLARLGGDEFAIFFPNISPQEARQVAKKVSEVLSESYFIDRLRFQVEASVGVAHFPHHGSDGHELLRCADVAMYEAKNSAKAVVEFTGELDTTTPLRIAVLSGLDQALSEGQLSVVYQPLMSTATGLTGGFEALVRWTHPEFGPLSPAEFIAIAEMGEGIRKITDFVVRQTLANLKVWRRIIPDLHIAVNISPRVLLDHHFPEIIEGMLKEFDLPGESIVMELTESTLLVDPVRAVEIINMLGEIGIKVEIDDYGTGYSSLAYIKSLPISALKIDRSFVADILTDETNQVIVSSTIKMAHTLGLQTVAEGVEDEATLMLLRKYGCDMIQGYYYAKPLPEKEVVGWLKRNV
ncbi:EAL domain-containing protein [Reinekea marinisedimentorum]|uniref:Diguanylate cyclase (GGDEF)-like protein n=1 Tax=Reinekea marinisedimentorum TaxID=230495 RepID=A0A4R3I2W5_9GAMM|nr:EAL domain-containing protein [Reinekea marinisedimentorum]TCS38239.1 diguanylate cyclase (GGDEF)-like protein [Reinekea marinisedimentorum]